MPVPFARQDGQIGFPLDPIVLLRNPGFTRPAFLPFQAVFGGLNKICIPSSLSDLAEVSA